MPEAVEVRIRPHHHEGDVMVAHMEFPQGGNPVAGDSAEYAFSGWTHVDAIANDGNAVSIPLGADQIEYVKGFDVQPDTTQLVGPAGMYMLKMTLHVTYENAPPGSGFVDIQFNSFWVDNDSNEAQNALLDLEAAVDPSVDPAFEYPIAGSPSMTKFSLGPLLFDGHFELQMTNNTDIPLGIQGNVVIGKL